MDINIKKFSPTAIVPEFKTEGSAGADLCADETVVVKPGKASIIKLGIGFEIPKNHMMLLALRSSTPKKTGLFIANGVGIIDSDYAGEYMLCVATIGNEEITVNKGDRIAQAVLTPTRAIFSPEDKINFIEVDEFHGLASSERGEGGFGSTGI